MLTNNRPMQVTKEHVTHPRQAFRYLTVRTDGSPGAWHRHPQAELTWIEHGHGLRFVGDSTEPYGDGDLVLIGPDVPHLWLSSQPPPPGGIASRVVQFPPALLHDPALPELAAMLPVLDRAGVGLRVQGATQAAVSAHLARMAGEPPLARLGSLMSIFAALADPAAELSPIGLHAVRGTAGTVPERRIQRVIDWVHRHLGEPLPVAAAARVAHVTPAAFSRFFHRETGRTYTAYLNEVRLSAACLRLRRSDKPVALIAAECGFTSLTHFNRRFRAHTGMTPRDYRRR